MNDPLDDLIDRADRALSVMHDATEMLSALRIVRRSPDGLATVTVDGSGAMVDLYLQPDLSRESATQLENSIVVTAAEAAGEALRRRAAVLERMQSSLSDT